MAELTTELAHHVRTIVEQYLRDGGSTTASDDTERPIRRDARYYKAPAEGVVPKSYIKPGMAECELYMFDGEDIVTTQSMEDVWSRVPIPPDTIFPAHTLNGNIFATESDLSFWGTLKAAAAYGDTNIVVVRELGGNDVAGVSWDKQLDGGETLVAGSTVYVTPWGNGTAAGWRLTTYPCPDGP